MKNFKTLFLFLSIILIISCSKDERPEEIKEPVISKITISTIDLIKRSDTNLDGVCWDPNCGDPDIYVQINDQDGEQARITEVAKDHQQGIIISFSIDLIVDRTRIYHFFVFDEDPESSRDEILIQEGYKFDSIVDDQPESVMLKTEGNEIEITLKYELE